MATQKKSAETATATQELTLPYPEITTTANRETMRDVSKAGRATYYLDINIVTFRNAFNVRDISRTPEMTDEDWEIALEIPQLAALIMENGQEEPIEGDLMPGGTEFITTDGYRRTLAKRYLLRQGHTEDKKGKALNQIEVLPNAKGTTEIDRITRMLSSDVGKLKYRPIEISHGLLRLKQVFGLTHDQIGEKIGRSRQWVDNMIILAESPENVRLAIEKGVISATAANTLARNLKDDPEKFNNIIDEAIRTGEKISVKSATASITPPTPIENEKQPPTPTQQPGNNDGDGKLRDAKDELNKLPAGQTNPTEEEEEEEEDDDDDSQDNDNNEVVTNPVQSANMGDTFQQEVNSRQTSARPTDRTPKNNNGDALDKIDFSKDKTEIELELAETIKLLDRLEVKIGVFPDRLKQYKDDATGLAVIARKKLQNIQELMKKAPTRGDAE